MGWTDLEQTPEGYSTITSTDASAQSKEDSSAAHPFVYQDTQESKTDHVSHIQT